MSAYSSEDNYIPKFVEPEYNLDTQGPTIKEAEPDPCCTRCTSEWRYPGWFSIEEGGRTLDIPASFGPTSWQARLVKFCMMIWFNASLAYKWYTKWDQPDPAWFLAVLTNWSLIFACLWLIVSFINSIVPPAQPKTPSDSVSLWTKLCWLLFPVATFFTLTTVVLYWALDYKPGVSGMDYINVFTHVCVILIWPEGLYINRIPVRWKHLPLVMVLTACYVLWLVIHQMATDIGNPGRSDNDPETNDDLLYTAIDFEEKTVFSSVFVSLVVVVLVPVFHWLVWSLSLFSFPCNCSGYNRRYLSESTDKFGSGEATAMDNSNIYEP